jgi:hypothetical protein
MMHDRERRPVSASDGPGRILDCCGRLSKGHHLPALQREVDLWQQRRRLSKAIERIPTLHAHA